MPVSNCSISVKFVAVSLKASLRLLGDRPGADEIPGRLGHPVSTVSIPVHCGLLFLERLREELWQSYHSEVLIATTNPYL